MDKETIMAKSVHRSTWKKTLTIIKFRFYITFSNCTVCKRHRQEREFLRKGDTKRAFIKLKQHALLESQNHCPVCGQECEYDDIHIHHILPYSRFPQLWTDQRNMLVCCTKCHSEIHSNPWRNIELMKQGGIDAGIRREETPDALIVTISIPKARETT